MKKLEGDTQVDLAKMLDKKSHNIGNFSGFFSEVHGQQAYLVYLIQSAFSVSIMVPAKVFSQTQVVSGQGASYSSNSHPSLELVCYY